MEIINVKNLTKIYKQAGEEIYALYNVSFSVNKGEFVAVVGASGSGKSTLIHTIGCVDVPTSGTIEIDGINVSDLDESSLTIFRRRQIGLVYQFYNLIVTLDVKDNIQLPILLDNKEINNTYYEELLERFQIKNRETHLPSELSGGEQQRVAIARALMNNPSILLLDEPTGNLDKANSIEIMKLVKESHKAFNQTIILITHDEDTANMADRIIKLEDGKIIYDEVL